MKRFGGIAYLVRFWTNKHFAPWVFWFSLNIVILASIAAESTQSVGDIKSRLEQVKIVAVTCLGITSPLLASKKFDICIMDEAGQTTLPVGAFCDYVSGRSFNNCAARPKQEAFSIKYIIWHLTVDVNDKDMDYKFLLHYTMVDVDSRDDIIIYLYLKLLWLLYYSYTFYNYFSWLKVGLAELCYPTISIHFINSRPKSSPICLKFVSNLFSCQVSLGPLMFASTFVLVGDHYQLPPLVQVP